MFSFGFRTAATALRVRHRAFLSLVLAIQLCTFSQTLSMNPRVPLTGPRGGSPSTVGVGGTCGHLLRFRCCCSSADCAHTHTFDVVVLLLLPLAPVKLAQTTPAIAAHRLYLSYRCFSICEHFGTSSDGTRRKRNTSKYSGDGISEGVGGMDQWRGVGCGAL